MTETSLEISKENQKEKEKETEIKNPIFENINTLNKEELNNQNQIIENSIFNEIKTLKEGKENENQEKSFLNIKTKRPKKKYRKFANILKQIDQDINKIIPIIKDEEIKKEEIEKEENQNIKNENEENNQIKEQTSISINNNEDQNTIKCTICLENINNNNIAKLDTCEHEFCKNCIKHWSNLSSECPICKVNYHNIIYYDEKNNKTEEKKVKKKKFKPEKEKIEQWYNKCDEECLICHQKNNTSYLLICDKCDFRICHTFCVGLNFIPDGEFICPECKVKEGCSKENIFNYNNDYINDNCKVKQSNIKLSESDNNKVKLVNKNKQRKKRHKKYGFFNGYFFRQHPKIFTLRKIKNNLNYSE